MLANAWFSHGASPSRGCSRLSLSTLLFLFARVLPTESELKTNTPLLLLSSLPSLNTQRPPGEEENLTWDLHLPMETLASLSRSARGVSLTQSRDAPELQQQ